MDEAQLNAALLKNRKKLRDTINAQLRNLRIEIPPLEAMATLAEMTIKDRSKHPPHIVANARKALARANKLLKPRYKERKKLQKQLEGVLRDISDLQ